MTYIDRDKALEALKDWYYDINDGEADKRYLNAIEDAIEKIKRIAALPALPVLETTDSPKCPLCDDTGWVNVGLGFDADPRDAVRCERGCPAEKRSPVPVLETKKEES